MKGNFTGFTGDGKMVNVENVELTNSGSIDRTFSAKGVDGATQYTIKGTTNTVNLSDLAAAGIIVNLEGVQRDTTVGFTANGRGRFRRCADPRPRWRGCCEAWHCRHQHLCHRHCRWH